MKNLTTILCFISGLFIGTAVTDAAFDADYKGAFRMMCIALVFVMGAVLSSSIQIRK